MAATLHSNFYFGSHTPPNTGPSMTNKNPSSRSYMILIFLSCLNILNMVDRNLLASFGPQITEELNLSDSQFGLLVGLFFVFFYSIMGLFMGMLADRVNRPRLMAFGVALWSLCTILSGAAKNFVQIGIARMMIGVGEATLTPSAMSLLSDLFPASRRGLAAGVYYLGIPLGAGASFLVAGLLGPVIGWRNCFYLLGITGLLLSLALFLLRDPPRGAQDDSTQANKEVAPESLRESIPLLWENIRDNLVLRYTMLSAILLHIGIGGGQFGQIWMVRERDFDAAYIATIFGWTFIIVGTLGTFFGGIISDWYQSRYSGGRTRILGITMLALAPLIIVFRLSDPSSALFFVGMSAALMSMTVFYGPVFSTVQDESPAHIRGSTTALLLLACNMLGLGVGSGMAGLLSDMFANAGLEDPLTKALITLDIVAFFTAPLLLLASVHYERRKVMLKTQ
jgi:MFS family permease